MITVGSILVHIVRGVKAGFQRYRDTSDKSAKFGVKGHIINVKGCAN